VLLFWQHHSVVVIDHQHSNPHERNTRTLYSRVSFYDGVSFSNIWL